MSNPQSYKVPAPPYHTNGKYLYFIDRKHPLSDRVGRVYIHRHIASIKLSRWLLSEEHVHHQDGNPGNNTKTNLVILSRTDHAKQHKPVIEDKICACGKKFTPQRNGIKFCSQVCSHFDQRRAVRPDRETLLKDTMDLGFSGTGRKYGVTDNAIRKWLGLRE